MIQRWRKEKAKGSYEYTISHVPGSNIISQHMTLVGENTADHWTTIRYLCLPDTIHPRGK